MRPMWVVLAFAGAVVSLTAVPGAAARPSATDSGGCDKHPIVPGPLVDVGECGDLAQCIENESGQFGVYASVLGFGVLPEHALFYCHG